MPQKNVYVILRQWLQPWWRPISKDASDVTTPDLVAQTPPAQSRGLTLHTTKAAIADFRKLQSLPELNSAWCYHDGAIHQVLAHLRADGRNDFPKEKRDDSARQSFKPLIYPTNVKYDRTHLIPFGYHGKEDNPYLLIGWSNVDNQGLFAKFENKQSDRGVDLYWFTTVLKNDKGAVWAYAIYDARSKKFLDAMQSVAHGPFFWAPSLVR